MSRLPLLTSLIFFLWLCIALPSNAYQTSAKAGIIIDYGTGAVLFEKNADLPLPPASLSKLMTLYAVFEALEAGRLTLDEKLPVSRYAMRSTGGSSMFLDTRDRVRVEDLIRGVVVLSGNDACVVLAESLSPDGTEAGFSKMLTQRGLEIGLRNSTFANSSGWPNSEHKMSVRDLAILTQHLLSDFPQYYHYFAEKEFLFDNRTPENRYNRNPLLKRDVPGADGLKTGYTRDSGYGIVGSAEQDGLRVLFVLNGINSSVKRAEEAETIVGWYNRNFIRYEVFAKNETIIEAPVWLGKDSIVPATVERDLVIPLPLTGKGTVDMQAVFDGIVEAPITEGQVVGYLEVNIPDLVMNTRYPLIAQNSVEVGGIITRISSATHILFQKYVVNPIKSFL